jgi:hypothetical protein
MPRPPATLFHRALLIGLAAIGLVAISLAARADESPAPEAARATPAPTREVLAEARRAFERGVARYRVGDAKGALGEFRRSYGLVPEPGVLYNLGLVQRSLGQLVEAADSLRKYLETARGIGADRRASVRQVLSEIRRLTAELQVQGLPAGTRVTLDGAPLGVAPLGPRTVTPGAHVIEAQPPPESPGPPRRRRLELSPGSRLVLDFDGPAPTAPVTATLAAPVTVPTAPRPEAPPVEPSRPIYKRWWFWTLLALAVAGGVAGGVIGAQRSESPTGNLGPGSFTFR